MANGETFRGTIIGRIAADNSAVVFDFGYQDITSGSAIIDTGTAAGDFQTLMQAAFVACLPDDTAIERYRFACVGGAAKGAVGFVDVPGGIAGSLTAVDRMPNEIAICLKRNTGYATRSDRGRVFLGPVATALIDGPNDVNTTNGYLQALRDKLKDNLTTQGRTLRPVLLKADGTTNGRQIVNVGINPVFCHRRTRRPRIGS